ncbi:galactokinase [Planctomycetales bacterium]|nr:galactokinase [Planctomycetales bacterium]GHT34896.1 galactokinase [Planctomycetales bacterium]
MAGIESLAASAATVYARKYGKKPQWFAAAPGRVNLIGEHTDYNDGFVFPMAIERYTVIVAGPAEGETDAEFYSMYKNKSAFVPIDGSSKPPLHVAWFSYIQGTVQNVYEAGLKIPPFRAVVVSDVPLGGGLSSSASLEVAVATLLEAAAGKKLDPVEKALLCQKAEHLYAKMPCGIMDQFISAMGEKGYAMLLDCRSKVPKMIPLDSPDVSVLIINSNVKHTLTGSEYPDRRKQCEKAAALMGVTILRDADLELLNSKKEIFDKEMDGSICFRRAKHVITENARTVAMAEALTKQDWNRCGELMYASHISMKDDFEITCPEIDILVDIASKQKGVFGSRMTGGGFGGCTVSLVEAGQVNDVIKNVSEEYERQTGIILTAFATQPAQGAFCPKI